MLKIGDIVQLKSGGPHMTVKYYVEWSGLGYYIENKDYNYFKEPPTKVEVEYFDAWTQNKTCIFEMSTLTTNLTPFQFPKVIGSPPPQKTESEEYVSSFHYDY